MRITESRLRSIIRKIILESVEVGRRIKPGFNIDVASFAYVLRSIAKYASTGHDFDMYTSDEAEKSDIVSQSNLEGLEIKISELDRLHSILGGQMNLYNDDITSVIKISKSIFVFGTPLVSETPLEMAGFHYIFEYLDKIYKSLF